MLNFIQLALQTPSVTLLRKAISPQSWLCYLSNFYNCGEMGLTIVKEYEEFLKLLEAEDKQNAVLFAIGLLDSGKMDVRTLYTKILTPSLNQMACRIDNKRICVWKEHIRTAIVRTIIECCYPYVIKEFENYGVVKNKTAVVLCPPEEYHDLGARMIADFFTLCGFNSIFVGSNTPYQDFYDAADIIRPDIIAISITNYYTLVVSKKIITELKEMLGDSTKIVVGGYAVRQNSGNFEALGADCWADTFEDIQKITNETGDLK